MNALKNSLGISKNVKILTTAPPKETEFTKFEDQIPPAKGWNYMGDVLHLPTTEKGFKYLLVICDLAERTFDMEPMKECTDKGVLNAYKKMIHRTFIKLPEYTMATDAGNEFKGDFDKFLKHHKIYHKIAKGGRHKQQGPIEALNKLLGSFFNGYMNQKEEETGKVYREWTDKIKLIRNELNRIRREENKKEFNPFHNISEPVVQPLNEKGKIIPPKFNVGDEVYVKNEKPKNALGRNQSTSNFRTGDYYWNSTPKEIEKILEFSGNVPYRYIVEGIKGVSYTDKELKKA